MDDYDVLIEVPTFEQAERLAKTLVSTGDFSSVAVAGSEPESGDRTALNWYVFSGNVDPIPGYLVSLTVHRRQR